MKDKYYLLTERDDFEFYVQLPSDIFVINIFPDDYDISNMVTLVFSPDKSKILGVIVHEES